MIMRTPCIGGARSSSMLASANNTNIPQYYRDNPPVCFVFLPSYASQGCFNLLRLTIGQPNRNLSLPFPSIWLFIRPGKEGLQARAERITILRLPPVPHYA